MSSTASRDTAEKRPAVSAELREKEARLRRFFEDNPRAALAFSGGVDSAYLFYAASRFGGEVRAFYAATAFQPAFELADAQALAAYLDRPLTVIEPDVFACPEAVANGPRRCYFCKRTLFTALWEQARAYGFDLLLDGSNASDDAGERPGMQALRELRVASPLRECGLTKADIRVLSREAGLFTWDKPSYSCLATRVAQGQPLTRDLLSRVEAGEMALMELGFSDFRLRVRGDDALLQVTADQMEQARDRWDEITKRLQPLFSGLSLDAQARKGSL